MKFIYRVIYPLIVATHGVEKKLYCFCNWSLHFGKPDEDDGWPAAKKSSILFSARGGKCEDTIQAALIYFLVMDQTRNVYMVITRLGLNNKYGTMWSSY